ncbi:unnamed protein product [Candida verbasci]|uniref:Uncharacterized protein n=1 Tax=Candida verbasci TaxID=1227364 RepID=A0A9W4TYS2_9ASCO|nr:unnamed protein product [Candida verbasci]
MKIGISGDNLPLFEFPIIIENIPIFDHELSLTEKDNCWLYNEQITKEEIKRILYDSLELIIQPKKIFIVDYNFSLNLKRNICEVLFNFTKYVIFIPASVLMVFGDNKKNGLVIDYGWECCTISKVFELRQIYSKQFPFASELARKFDLYENVDIEKIIKESDIDLRKVFRENIVKNSVGCWTACSLYSTKSQQEELTKENYLSILTRG